MRRKREETVVFYSSMSSTSLGLCVKPFGKEGVRLLYAGGGQDCILEVRRPLALLHRSTNEEAENCKDMTNAEAAAAWEYHADAPEAEGVIIIKGSTSAGSAVTQPSSSATSGPPRLAAWRLRRGSEVSDVAQLAKPPSASSSSSGGSQSAGGPSPAATVSPLDDAELAFNILQWFGTVVIDCRQGATHRLRESILCADVATVASLPTKDDAIVIGAPQDVLDALATRVRRGVHVLSERALHTLCSQHSCLAAPCVAAEAAEDGSSGGSGQGAGGSGRRASFSTAAAAAAATRRPVLPNLVDGTLLVGHQGHALCIADWQRHVRLGGVVNLAPEKVDASKAREAALVGEGGDTPAWDVLELKAADGLQLTDKPGDGERLLEALPMAIEAIRSGSGHDGKLVFVHCQQGRSRAGSIATAWLLTAHDSWTLFDAIAFLAARRPETEIFEEYAQALERWAVDSLGRQPSLQRVHTELPRQIRPLPLQKGGDASLMTSNTAAQATAIPVATPKSASTVEVTDPASSTSGCNRSRPPLGPGAEAAGLPRDSPCSRGSFGPAAIRRASPPHAR